MDVGFKINSISCGNIMANHNYLSNGGGGE
jgi:hypothetical protein